MPVSLFKHEEEVAAELLAGSRHVLRAAITPAWFTVPLSAKDHRDPKKRVALFSFVWLWKQPALGAAAFYLHPML